jgi:hypothetical protein
MFAPHSLPDRAEGRRRLYPEGVVGALRGRSDETGQDIGDDIVAQYRHLLPAGSYLTISHVTDEGVPDDAATRMVEVKQLYDSSSSR